MDRSVRRFSGLGIALLLPLLIGGCSSARGIWPETQSHYTPADIKIVPVGQVKASASDWFFTFGGLADIMHPDIPEEAMQTAIREKKADLLIDYTLSLRGTRAPIFLIPGLDLWWVTWTAEGTAAKMNAGMTIHSEAEKTPSLGGR